MGQGVLERLMTKKISRRRFIETSALATSAAVFTPSIIEAWDSGTISIVLNPTAQKQLSSYDTQVRALLAQMTLEEKIGQMTQAGQEAMKDGAERTKVLARHRSSLRPWELPLFEVCSNTT